MSRHGRTHSLTSSGECEEILSTPVGNGHGHGANGSVGDGSVGSLPSSGAKCRTARGNPLETLLKDLKCSICLSVTRAPVSLPCNHFFCQVCLLQLMDQEGKKAAEARKAKSNASLKLTMACPECRREYNRRNIVEDPVVRKLAQLCAQLQMQPDVRELMSADDSIFDLSQASPLSSPAHPTKRPSVPPSAFEVVPFAAASSSATSALPPVPVFGEVRATPTARRKLNTALMSPVLSPTPTAASSSSAKRAVRSLTPPHIPSDPFEFAPAAALSSHSAAKSKLHSPSAALADDSADALQPRSGRLPQRKAALVRRSYKEMETQVDSFTQDDSDGEDAGRPTEGKPLSTPPQKGRGHLADLSDGDEEEAAPRMTFSRAPPPSAAASTPSPPSSGYKMKKTYPPVPLPVDGCAVCGLFSEEEAVVTCRECKVQVHSQLCYGPPGHTITDAERASWYCDRCSQTMGTKKVACCVCPNTEDQAFKKTDKGTWIHASCAQWLSAPRYRDADRRRTVMDVNKIPKDCWSVPCKFCTGKGAILQCSYGHGGMDKCVFGYHVPCGVRFGIEFEIRGPDAPSQEASQEEEECDDVFFHSFCKKHQPLKHLVPSCNSKLAASAKKPKKRRAKRGRKAAVATAADDADSDGAEAHDAKRSKRSSSEKAVNRSINLAETSMDTSVDSSRDGGVMETPSKSDALFRSLFNGPSTSPFTTPLALPPSSISYSAASTPDRSAIRKLAFTPPAITASVGISLRTSPAKSAAMLRSASTGSMSSQSTPATSSKAPPSRTSSLKQTPAAASPAAAAAAVPAAAAPHSTRHSSAAAAAAAASIPSTPTGRAPLRSMARDEVHSRDSLARNSAASPLPYTKSSRKAARRHIVLLGTKLDTEQQELLVELVAVLNAAHEKTEEGSGKVASSKLVSVQHHFDSSVTHVITTTSESEGYILQQGRTIKYFQGLLSGAWVLGVDWVAACLCGQKIVPENDFLVRGDAKVNDGEETHGAKRARNREHLFAGMNFVWSGAKTSSKADVLALIQLGGGVVAEALPGVTGGKTKRVKQQPAHDSDMDEPESQMEMDDYPVSDSPAVSPIKARLPSAAALASAGRWYLLVDDSGEKRGKAGASRLKVLQKYVTPADWQHCVTNRIDVVGVTWLFDSISAFRIQPTERPTK